MPRKLPDENAKVTLDEGVFQQILSAAFVIQEHNDSSKTSAQDPSEFRATDLSEIAETQNLIRGKRLDLISAANVIVERVQKISLANGAAIALVAKNELSYISSNGVAESPAGASVSLEQCLSAECIRTGQFSLVANLKNAPQAQAEFCRKHGIQTFATVPINHQQKVVGVLELYFIRPKAIDDSRLRTCQLLAGLLTGPIEQLAQQGPMPTIAPSSNPLEQLKPQLDRMFEEESDSVPDLVRSSLQQTANFPASSIAYKEETAIARCRNCGCPLEAEESFCGLCGTSRGIATESSKVHTAPTPNIHAASVEPVAVQKPLKDSGTTSPPAKPSDAVAGLGILPEKTEKLPAELQEILARFPEEQNSQDSIPDAPLVPAPVSQALPNAPAQSVPIKTELLPPKIDQKVEEKKAIEQEDKKTTTPTTTDPTSAVQWKSASETRAWLESVKKVEQPGRHWLAEHRANIYLAAAAILLFMVLFGVGIPNGPHDPAKPQLSLFDSLLVNLGLAEAPTTPVYLGNPNIKVWLDIHTALYYCPGAEQYGKTSGGKFETQREAQQDQFEPASRQACQ